MLKFGRRLGDVFWSRTFLQVKPNAIPYLADFALTRPAILAGIKSLTLDNDARDDKNYLEYLPTATEALSARVELESLMVFFKIKESDLKMIESGTCEDVRL